MKERRNGMDGRAIGIPEGIIGMEWIWMEGQEWMEWNGMEMEN